MRSVPRRGTRPRRIAALALCLALLGGAIPTASAAELPPGPASLVAAPSPLDPYVPYEGQTVCDATAKPGAQYVLNMVLRFYKVGRWSSIGRACDSGGRSEHKEGRALDWGVNVNNPVEKAAGDQFVRWLTAVGPDGKSGYNARRLGVMYVIWNTQIWSNSGAGSVWKAYTGASPHTDHIHVSLSWNGAYMRTSWWTGSAVPDQPAVRPTVYDDEPDSPAVAGPTDITRYALRLDGSKAKATTYLREWDPAVLTDTTFSATLDVAGDANPEFLLRKVGSSVDPTGPTVLYRYVSGVAVKLAGCTVTLTTSAAARSISLSVPAACVGSPKRARLRVATERRGGTPASDSAPAAGWGAWVTAGPSGPDVPVLPVYRFWSPRFNNAHFFTASIDEAANIRLNDPNWTYEGRAFQGFVPDGGTCATPTAAVYRFYSGRFQAHFFTASAAERDQIAATDPHWAYEGVAYCATPTQEPGTIAIYRFWSPRYGKHHYTANPAEAAQLDVNDPSWDYEGIAFYVAP